MAKQVRTASASRWVTGVFALGALSAAAATGLAAPAAADTSSYLDEVAPRYVYLSESQLLDAGQQACANARRGVPGSDSTVALSKSLGISLSAAATIVRAGITHLGC